MAIKFLSGVNVDNNTLFVDDANNRVGIGTSGPQTSLDVQGSINIKSTFNLTWGGPYGAGTPTITGSSISSFISFYPAGSTSGETMRITAAGNVGIGTTAPAAYSKLQVKVGTDFNLAIGQDTGAVGIGAYNDAANATANLNITGTVISFSSGGERMRITSGGNVGIGTTAPVSTNLNSSLTIYKSYNGDTASVPSVTAQTYYENQSGLYLFGRNSGLTIVGANGENNEIVFANASSKDYAKIGAANGTTSAGGDMYFRTGGNVEAMRITTSGNVGIGTTSPSSPRNSGFRPMLHVYNNSVGTNPSVVVSCEDNQMAGYIAGDNAGASDIGWGWNAYYQGNGNNFFNIRIGDNGTWTDRFTIDRYGNVGIGTTAPANKLDVRGIARVLSDDAINAKILYYTPSPYGMVFRAYGSGANSIQVQREANDAELFPLVLQPNGSNVGIGTTAPDHKLHVASSTAYGTVARVLKLDQANSGGDVTQPTYYGSILLSGNGYNWGAIDTIQTNPSASWASRMAFSTMPGSGDYNLYERMSITSAGNVGIGTTSPSYKLQVEGAGRFSNGASGTLIVKHNYYYHQPNWGIKLDGDTGSSGGYLSQYIDIGGFELAQGATYYGGGPWLADSNSTTYSAVVGNGGTLIFSTNSGLTAGGTFFPSERMRITADGNVGIGTTAPTARLHVSGGDGIINNAFIGVIPAYGANYTEFSHTSRSAAGKYSFLSGNAGDTYVNSANGQAIYFRHENIDLGLFTADGKFGIGTTAPTMYGGRGMEVSGAGQTGIRISDTSGGGKVEIGSDSSGGYIQTASAGNNLTFYTGNASTLVMRMTAAGNVGIGTTAPDSYYATNLVVASGAEGGVTIAGNSSGENYYMFADGTNGADRYRGYIGYNHSSNHMRFGTDGNERMRIDASGNVGIGTTAPTNVLHVVGVPRFDANGGAPSDTSGTVVNNKYYGNNFVALTSPNEWLKVDINGTAYVIPAYSI